MNYNEEYFTVEATGTGYINLNLINTGSDTQMESIRFYYWKNTIPNVARDNYDGTLVGGAGNTSDGSRLNYVAGDIIRLYRPEQTAVGNGINNTNRFSAMANCKIYGNIASLIGYANELPEKGLQILFFYGQFTDCSNLIIPWDTIPKWGMRWMFYGCNKFNEIPYLPATNVGAEGYHQIFRQCNGIVNVDFNKKMGCRSAGDRAFQQMFFQTTSLQSIKIPANINYTGPYAWNGAFYNCSALSSVTCLDLNPTTNNIFNTWLNGVAATGTFIKAAGVTWNSGTSGIPAGWTVKNMNPQTQTIDYSKVLNAFSKSGAALRAIFSRGGNLLWGSLTHEYNRDYLTIECTSDGDFSFDGTWMSPSYNSYDITLYYSKNGGQWTEIHSTSPTTLSAVTGDKFRFKGINNAISPMVETKQTANTFRFTSGRFKAYGNVMSVLFGDNFRNATLTTGINDYAFKDLFNQTGTPGGVMGDIENIILPDVLTPHCFRAMFQNTAIYSAPKLPATTLAEACYRYMFGNCSDLISAPELPAATLVDYCYYGMFYYCTNLRYIKCFATSGINTNNSTASWVNTVFSSGKFYKDSSATWPTGNNGIPTTWTVKDIVTTIPDVPTIICHNNKVTITSNGADTIYYRDTEMSTWNEYTGTFNLLVTTTYEAYATNDFGNSAVCTPVECQYIAPDYQYFTIELLENGSFLWKMLGSDASYTIEYSKNDGTWTSITSSTDGVEVTGNEGDIFRIRGNNARYTINNSSTYNRNYSYFDFISQCKIYGNIMSLINGDNFIDTELTSSNTYAFCSLFKPTNTTTGSYLINSKDLILPVASTDGCFRAMFAFSKHMTAVPDEIRVLENGTTNHACYYMFQDCDEMTKAPKLWCGNNDGKLLYGQMFNGCNKLNEVWCLLKNPTFTSSGTCYNMFYNVGVSDGTLYKYYNSTWTRGGNGVPSRWYVINY